MNLHRRQLLAAAAASAALASLPSRLAAQARPPLAKTVDAADDYYGTRLTDPYRWMETGTDPDWMPWMRAQDAAARARLAALPGRAAMGARVAALSGESVATSNVVPLKDGGLLYEQRPAGSQTFALYLRDAAGNTRAVIDPGAMRDGSSHVSLDWWEVSDDGRHIAYGLSPAGSEASVLHVMELASGTVLPTRIPNTDFGAVEWLGDSSGFLYLAMTGPRGTPQFYLNSEQRLHRLGTDPATDTVVLKRGQYPAVPMTEGQFPFIATIAGTPWAVMATYDQSPETPVYVAREADIVAGRPEWIKVADDSDAIVNFAATGDDLYLISEKDAPRRKLLRTRLSAPDLANAVTVIAQGPMVLEDVWPSRETLVVQHLDGGVHKLSRVTGTTVTPIALPFAGAAEPLHAGPLEEDVYATLQGWLEPARVVKIAPDNSITDTGLTPRPPVDVSPFVAEQRFAVARDGTRIPYTLMAKRGWTANGRNPVLATAYGAYGYSATPGFTPRVIAFLEAGGIFVDAAVRGGGDYGREWHDAGKKATKANTWRDLIDVCEALVAERVTAPAYLVGHGVSAGGITIGRAITERPDLFAGAIAEVGFMNPIRYVAEQNVADIEEWGPITDAESFRIMYAMDAYRAVLDAPTAPPRWPRVMVTTGINDPRAASFHSAKFAAALQARGADAMLRVDFDAGHGIGSTRDQTDALRADQYAWVLSLAA